MMLLSLLLSCHLLHFVIPVFGSINERVLTDKLGFMLPCASVSQLDLGRLQSESHPRFQLRVAFQFEDCVGLSGKNPARRFSRENPKAGTECSRPGCKTGPAYDQVGDHLCSQY